MNTVIFPLLLIVVLLLVSVVTLIVALVRGKRGLAIASGAGLLLLLFVPAVLLFTARVSEIRATVQPRQETRAPAAWAPTLDDDPAYLADVYPTQRDAAAALGARVGDRSRLLADNPDHLLIGLRSTLGESPITEGFAEALRRQAPGGISVTVVEDPQALADEPVTARVAFRRTEITESPAAWDETLDLPQGTLTATVEHDGRTYRMSTDFVEKPWVHGPPALPGARQQFWTVARSDELAASAELARVEAASSAANILAQPIRDRIHEHTPPMHRIRDTILHDDAIILDSFTQRFERSYGSVYRTALLIDASDATVEALAADLARQPLHRSAQRRNAVLAIGALIVVLLGLYAFLQVATRGYYTGAVRSLVIVLFVGGIAGVVLLVLNHA